MATTNDHLWIGTRKGLIEARRTAEGWHLADEVHMRGKPIPYAVHDPRTESVWASIDHGHWGCKLMRQRNGGAFEEVTPPKYPESAGVAAKYYWVLTPGHADEPGTFHVGTEPGGLFTTTDDGASWTLNEALWSMRGEHKWMGGGRDDAGIHSICVDPRDAKRLVIAISCAGVLESTDGGATWTYANVGMGKNFLPPEQADLPYGFDPHFVAQSAGHPDVLWQANHCGVFRTTDVNAGWDTLTQKPLVDFGFPVAAHPTDPDQAWIVPMESDQIRTCLDGALVVMHTRDAGATWTEQRVGLPQNHAFDFPYRHGLDVDPSGDVLAFGTTSGNLYITEDGGASWSALAHNLPPIYSVRFA